MKTDVQIQQDVLEQLKWEPILNAAEVCVSVKNLQTPYEQLLKSL